MGRIITALSAAAICCILMVSGVRAEVACFPLADIVAQISGEKYAEKPAMSGILNGSGLPLVIFANPETGTWTALRLHPDGKACIVGTGTGFKEAPFEVPGVPL